MSLPLYHFALFVHLLVDGGVNDVDEAGAFPVLEYDAGAVVVVALAFLLCLLD